MAHIALGHMRDQHEYNIAHYDVITGAVTRDESWLSLLREQERLADIVGLELLVNAGIDYEGAIEAIRNTTNAVIDDQHGTTAERVQVLRDEIAFHHYQRPSP